MKTEAEIKTQIKKEQSFYEIIDKNISEEVRFYAMGWINALIWVLNKGLDYEN